MTQADLSFYRKWFKQFVAGFYSENETDNTNLKVKEMHSYRVQANMIMLAKDMNFSESDAILAGIIGLFHDIGRFKQYEIYKSYVDKKTESHGLLGLAVLEATKVFDNLAVTERNIIIKAIDNHNRLSINDGLSERELLFARMIRDADKLDIWKVVTDYYDTRHVDRNPAIELELPDIPEYNKDILDDLMNERLTDTKNIKTLFDFMLLQIGWIYDMHFPASFRSLKDKGYLDIIFKHLPDDDTVRRIKPHVYNYLERHG